MAPGAREFRISRRSWLLAGLGIGVSGLARGAELLKLSFDGDNLHVGAPNLHFLTGKPLQRLKDAATVTFVSQLTLFSDAQGTVFKRAAERLVVSYDLWEEKFSVTIPGRGQRKPFIGGAAQVEQWAFDNLAISAMGMAPERPFWLRLDLRTAERRELAAVVGDSGLSLGALIDLFSRRPGSGESSWTANFGPFRLIDLPRTPSGRGRLG
jgi:hypothetical protein